MYNEGKKENLADRLMRFSLYENRDEIESLNTIGGSAFRFMVWFSHGEPENEYKYSYVEDGNVFKLCCIKKFTLL